MNNISTQTTAQHKQPVHSFSPAVILGRPDTLQRLTQSYFKQLSPEAIEDLAPDASTPAPQADPPTAAGLALHLGFSSTNTMLNAATTPSYPEESRHIIMQALTAIEEGLVTLGLTDRINTSLTKHILSAQHNIIPKKEVHEVKDATVTIRVVSHNPSTQDEATEIDRLEQVLIEQTTSELAAMSGQNSSSTDSSPVPSPSPSTTPTIEELF